MHPNALSLRPGYLPPGAIGHGRAVVKPNYAFMPPEGILSSRLPDYEQSVVHFQAAPALGAEFAQALLAIAPGGGTRGMILAKPQHFFFVIEGTVVIRLDGGEPQELTAGGFAYLPQGTRFSLRNESPGPARVERLTKPYESIGLPPPDPIVSHRDKVPATNLTGAEGRNWKLLLGAGDFRFDMEINILSFQPGAYFPDVETHIMEHGLVMLEGQGLYYLAGDWHEIWAGDFIWMGPYCPQQFYPTGFGEAAYLLYKNVNRDISF